MSLLKLTLEQTLTLIVKVKVTPTSITKIN
jgi:hypothetical protein